MRDGWAFAFLRGRDDYRRGRPRPPLAPPADQITRPEHARYYGWLVEQAGTVRAGQHQQADQSARAHVSRRLFTDDNPPLCDGA